MSIPTLRELLRFEKAHPHTGGAKDTAIRAEWDISPTVYFQRLNAALDDPLALAMEPGLINRLRHRREQLRADRPRIWS